MDALVTVRDWKWTISWSGHACSGDRAQLEMDEIMAWAWTLWSPRAVGNGRYYGLGMEALVAVRN